MEKLDLAYYDFHQLILTIFIVLFGLLLSLAIGAKKIVDVKYIVFIYLWHTFFSFYYWFHSLTNTADATLYYLKSFTLELNLSPGTRFAESVSYIITQIFGSNYLNTTLVSNWFGSIGLVLLYLVLKKYFYALNKYWVFILFLPSMSFWSAGLGKDSISFMATCLFIYGIIESKRSTLIVSIAFLSMFMVRPHVAFIMLASFVIYFIIRSKVHLIFKLIALPAILAGITFASGFVIEYVGLEDASLGGIDGYIDQRQSYNQGGGSSLDISSMSYPMQMFTYIFRPLPFEAHNMLALITSIENTLLLILFLYIVLKSNFNFKYWFQDKNLWLFTYFFLTCTILAVTTPNLGIASRQKWMFMPILIYLLIYTYYKYRTKNNEVYK